jgi:hypothetical protein
MHEVLKPEHISGMITSEREVDDLFMTPEFIEGVEKHLIPVIRSEDSPRSFAAFYRYMTGGPLPKHCRKWIDTIYEGKATDKATLTFAFRGSWKTTTISILFVAYRMGKEPQKTNLILQNNDAKGQRTTLAIANIIERDPKWKDCFPNVVPDKGNGWGAQGYWIKDDSVSPEEWQRDTVIDSDPSLLGLGISSGSVIGMHPTGVLDMDDIHDEKNTVSELERSKVVKVLTDTILPMIVPDGEKEEGQQLETWILAVGTPWHEDDAYHYMQETGEFLFCFTPLLFPVDEVAEGAIYFEHKKLIGWYRLGWPERCPPKVVRLFYNLAGHRGFGRMYLLSLAASNELGIPFHSFPNEEIPKGPIYGGVDYASVIEIRGKVMDAKNRDKFAFYWGVITPKQTLVIIDGIVGHFTQLQSEGHVNAIETFYLDYQTTGVEMNGKGEEFFAVRSRNPNASMFPYWVQGRKPDRLEKDLAPWIENGRILISDADTHALNFLRKALTEFPHGNMDCLDAVYAIAKCVPHILQNPYVQEGTFVDPNAMTPKKRFNPFGQMGRR